MLNCPFCDAQLGEDRLRGGRCFQCGSLLAWEEPADPGPPLPKLPALAPSVEPTARAPVPFAATTVYPPASPGGVPTLGAPVSSGGPAASPAGLSLPGLAGESIQAGTGTLPGGPAFEPSAALLPRAPNTPSAGHVERVWHGTYTPSHTPQMTIKAAPAEVADYAGLVIRPHVVVRPGEWRPQRANYDLQEKIGEGGVGVVYAARQASIDRTVAVKMLKPVAGDDTDSRQKFLAEAMVTGDLDHPNIVPIYDLGKDEQGAPFYSMKRVKGTPWSECLRNKSLTENLDILLKVADAIAFAHARGVVHRDIKPENVMLGDFGEVLVMDWGIALSTSLGMRSGNITQSSSMGGTPAYMAPEMATGPLELIGPRSDVYLLGAVLYEILTGHPPHSGKDVLSCLYAAARNDIQPTASSSELLDVAYRAMATHLNDRYASVREFQDAIRTYQSHFESVILATRSEDDLQVALRSKRYEDFSRALYTCEESLQLWPENVRARTLLGDVRLAYAGTALAKEDFDLGLSLLDPEDATQQPLYRQLLAGQSERNVRQHRLQQLRRGLMVLIGTVFIVIMAGLIFISGKNRELDVQRTVAVEAQLQAVSEQKVAQEQRARAEASNAQLTVEQSKLKQVNSDLVDERQRADEGTRLARIEGRRAEQASYISRIGLAAAQIRENAFLNIRESLQEYENSEQSHLRHWEWGRLRYLCDLAEREREASGRIESLALLPQGPWLLVATAAGQLEIWSVNDLQPLARWNLGAAVRSVAASPDGRWVAASVRDGSGNIHFWGTNSWKNPATMPEIAPDRILEGHGADVVSLAFSSDATLLASSSLDQTARLWDVASGNTKHVLRGHAGPVWQVALSPDQRQLATAGDDRVVALWDVATGRRSQRFRGHRGPVFAVAYAPAENGKAGLIASAGLDRSVLVWDPARVEDFDYEEVRKQLEAEAEGGIAASSQSVTTRNYRTFQGHMADVVSLQFSRDRRFVVSGGNDNTVRVWDLKATLPEAVSYRVLRGHGGWVRSLLPLGDARIVSGGYDQRVKVWDFPRYSEHRVLQAHEDAILQAKFSRDGTRVVTGGRDRQAIAWNADTGELIAVLREGHAFLTSTALFFPAGDDRIATSAGDGSTIVWNRTSGGELRPLTGTGQNAVAAVSPDGHWLVTGSDQPEALLWDTRQSGDWQAIHLEGHQGEVTCAAFGASTGDGPSRLFIGDATGHGQLWQFNRASGDWERKAALLGPVRGFAFHAARFSADGQRLWTTGADRRLREWTTEDGKPVDGTPISLPGPGRLLELSRDATKAVVATTDPNNRPLLQAWELLTHQRVAEQAIGADSLHALTWLDDGKSIAFASSDPDNAVWRWNLTNAAPEPFWKGSRLRASVWGLAVSPDGEQLLTAGGDHARLWSVADGRRVQSYSPHGPVTGVDISENGDLVVTASSDGSAKLWDVAPARVLARVPTARGKDGRTTGLSSVCFIRADRETVVVATAGDDGVGRVWTLAGETFTRGLELRGHHGELTTITTSPDAQHLLTASRDHSAILWNLADGQPVRVYGGESGHRLAVLCATFSQDGTWLATGSDDNTAILWDAASGMRLRQFSGHTASVTAVAVSPDGRRLVTASNDGTAKLWDAESGSEILSLDAHASEVTSVSFSADGTRILTAGRDQKAIIWPAQAIPPAIAFIPDNVKYDRGLPWAALDPEADFCDPDVTTFANARLEIRLSGEPVDGLTEGLEIHALGESPRFRLEDNRVLVDRPGVPAKHVATIHRGATPAQLDVHFEQAADHRSVENVLRAIAYRAEWQGRHPTPRRVDVTFVDAQGVGSAVAKKTIEFVASAEDLVENLGTRGASSASP